MEHWIKAAAVAAGITMAAPVGALDKHEDNYGYPSVMRWGIWAEDRPNPVTVRNPEQKGTEGNDSLGYGTNEGPGDDIFDGGSGHDAISAGVGDDLIWGGDGDDRLGGGPGNDTMYGGRGNDGMDGNTGADFMDGQAGNDRMSGWRGHDTMYGGDGNDWMWGGRGKDTLEGGKGNDKMKGGKGRDRFVFDSESGRDKVTDFQLKRDKLVFRGYDFADLEIKQGRKGAVITGPNDDWRVLLVGVKAKRLNESHFEFIPDPPPPATRAITQSFNAEDRASVTWEGIGKPMVVSVTRDDGSVLTFHDDGHANTGHNNGSEFVFSKSNLDGWTDPANIDTAYGSYRTTNEDGVTHHQYLAYGYHSETGPARWVGWGYWMRDDGVNVEMGAFLDGPAYSERRESMPATGTATYKGETQAVHRYSDAEGRVRFGQIVQSADIEVDFVKSAISFESGKRYAYGPGAIRYSARASVKNDGTFGSEAVSVTSLDSQMSVTSSDGAWGGLFTKADKSEGLPLAVSGTVGAEYDTDSGISGKFMGTFGARPMPK